MAGRTSRDKGARTEREAAHFFRAIFPDCARRSCGEESQSERGRDLKGTPGWVIQVQGAARPTPERKLLEAIAARGESDAIPLAYTRRIASRSGNVAAEAIVTLRAEDARLMMHFFEAARRTMPGRVAELARELEERDCTREERP